MPHLILKPVKKRRDPLAEFRAQCRQMTANSPFPTIERILAVGVNYNDAGYLFSGDQIFLERSIAFCHALNIRVSEDFEYIPLNIVRGPEHDFLDPDLKFNADLVTINYIYRFAEPIEHGTRIVIDRPPSHYLYGSRYNEIYKAWAYAVERTGAKLAVTFGNDDLEITSKDIARSYAYRALPIPEPEKYRARALRAAVRTDLIGNVPLKKIPELAHI